MPRCPECQWHLKLRIEAGVDGRPNWRSFCWNPNCKIEDVRPEHAMMIG